MLSPVRPSSVCGLLSVTFVRPTQPVEIFRNVSTLFDTLANGHPLISTENFTEIVLEEPVGGRMVKLKRDNQIYAIFELYLGKEKVQERR